MNSASPPITPSGSFCTTPPNRELHPIGSRDGRPSSRASSVTSAGSNGGLPRGQYQYAWNPYNNTQHFTVVEGETVPEGMDWDRTMDSYTTAAGPISTCGSTSLVPIVRRGSGDAHQIAQGSISEDSNALRLDASGSRTSPVASFHGPPSPTEGLNSPSVADLTTPPSVPIAPSKHFTQSALLDGEGWGSRSLRSSGSFGPGALQVDHDRGVLRTGLRGKPLRLSGSAPSGAIVPISPPEGVLRDRGYALIQRILADCNSDAAVDGFFRAHVSVEDVECMVNSLCRHPNLVVNLCLHHRGNVVANLLPILEAAERRVEGLPSIPTNEGSGTLHSLGGTVLPQIPSTPTEGPDRNQCSLRMSRWNLILRVIVDHFAEISLDQSGSIALVRIYDLSNQQIRCEINDRAASCFRTLALHPYGNFVASRILKATCENATQVQSSGLTGHLAHFASLFSTPGFFSEAASNKFGSHTLECWLGSAPEEFFLRTCGSIFRAPEILRQLCYDSVGNFPVQAMLRRLARILNAGRAGGFAQDLTSFPHLVVDSPYALNLKKAALGLEPKAKLPPGH